VQLDMDFRVMLSMEWMLTLYWRLPGKRSAEHGKATAPPYLSAKRTDSTGILPLSTHWESVIGPKPKWRSGNDGILSFHGQLVLSGLGF
jgi:hypothetical protein